MYHNDNYQGDRKLPNGMGWEAGQGYNQPNGYEPSTGWVRQDIPVFTPGHSTLLNWDPRKKTAAKDINKMAFLVVVQILATRLWAPVLISLLAGAGYNVFGYDEAYYWMLVVLVPLATLLPGVVYILASKTELNEKIRFEHRSALFTVVSVILSFGLCLLGNYPSMVFRTFLEGFGYGVETYMPSYFSMSECLLQILGIAILAPVVEEFIFRGLIMGKLEKHGRGLALVVSSLLFGMAHSEVTSVLFATIAGLGFGFAYMKTRNIWVPILVHMLNNGLSIAHTYSAVWLGYDDAEIFIGLTMRLPILLGLLVLIFILIFKRREFFSLHEPGESIYVPDSYQGRFFWRYPLRAGESINAVVRAPGFWVILSLVIVLTSQYFL